MIWSICVFIFKTKQNHGYVNRSVLSLPVKTTEDKLHRWRKHESRLYALDCPSLPEEGEYVPALHRMQLDEDNAPGTAKAQ
jgi:hypothetical protein